MEEKRKHNGSNAPVHDILDPTDGGKPAAGGTATISINGKKVGSARVDKTEPNVFSADETANVGMDKETPVSEDYTAKTSKFTGSIDKVTITVK